MLGLPFLGRQRITVTNERITVTSGFWTKVRDDIEIFRIRDVVVKQSLYHRMIGIGDVVMKSMEGRTGGNARAARRARPGRRQRGDPQPVEPRGAPGGAGDDPRLIPGGSRRGGWSARDRDVRHAPAAMRRAWSPRMTDSAALAWPPIARFIAAERRLSARAVRAGPVAAGSTNSSASA